MITRKVQSERRSIETEKEKGENGEERGHLVFLPSIQLCLPSLSNTQTGTMEDTKDLLTSLRKKEIERGLCMRELVSCKHSSLTEQ